MNYSWSRSVLPIAAIFSFRMLGLFMLIPVFTLYAPHLIGATPVLTGIALGSYGLSQGLLQLPFGLLSDRFGRKEIISVGLVLFIAGSLVGALSTSIYSMIIARILQGTGAIGSVLIALVADLTDESYRTRAMAVIGAAIGLSFSLAMVLSPFLTQHFGLASLFYLSTGLSLAGLLLLYYVIPTPLKPIQLEPLVAPLFLIKASLKNSQLLRLNAGIFLQHAILTSTFFIIPLLLQQALVMGHLTYSWQFYLPLMILSFILMIPLIILSERKNRIKPIFLISIAAQGLCQLGLFFYSSVWFLLSAFSFIYFIGFNFLEASLPSLVSRKAGATNKGTAMGIYSSCQFLGIFFGGSIAGLIVQYYSLVDVFMFNSLLALIWFMISLRLNTTTNKI